jgi:hypothetical protein
MGSSNGKPKYKNYTCLFIRPLFKFGGLLVNRLFYTRPTSYITHLGLLRGKSHFTTLKSCVLLEKGGFSTLSATRASRSESDRGIINTDNLKNFYE